MDLNHCYLKYMDDCDQFDSILQIIHEPVRVAQTCYDDSERADRVDVFVPASKDYLWDNTTEEDKYGEIIWNYRWNEREDNRLYADFEDDDLLQDDATIPIGTKIDRIGGVYGEYACQLTDHIYNVGERALPYYFTEDYIINEASYHIYNVLKPISYDALIADLEFRENSPMQYALLADTERKVVVGTVARVEAFEDQGIGGGIQIRFPVAIKVLLDYHYIWEDKPRQFDGLIYIPNT